MIKPVQVSLVHFALVLLLCILVPTAGRAQMPVLKKGQPLQRAELFVGNGTAGWVQNNPLLPTAKEIEAASQKLGSRQRNVGPFGTRMYPVEEDAVPGDSAITRNAERVTLNQALQTLRVTGINMERKEFLIGARNVFEGDVLEIGYRDEVFTAQVLQVTPSQILFRDQRRGETGVLALNLVKHLVLEPLQKRPAEARLEGKVTPMEPIKR